MGKLYVKKADKEPQVIASTEETPAPVKEKKPRTEKQLAALEKAKQARAAKKAAKEEEAKKLEAELAQKQEELKVAEEAKAAKKAAAAEKRRLAREQKKQEMTPAQTPEPSKEEIPKKKRKMRVPKEEPQEADTESEPQVKKPKRQRVPKIVDPDQPPKWFTGFMEHVKREKVAQMGEKKSVAEIKSEVKDEAQKTWNDGYTRDRIQSAQDKHLEKMYSMMFNNRKL